MTVLLVSVAGVTSSEFRLWPDIISTMETKEFRLELGLK
jgi:hypothetical protein